MGRECTTIQKVKCREVVERLDHVAGEGIICVRFFSNIKVELKGNNMKKRIISLAVGAMFLSGCATIIEGGTQPVTFMSVPDVAAISISNRAGEKVHTGTTPMTVTLKRGAGYFKAESYTVKVSKEGYTPKDITVTGSVNGWYVANILFGGLIGLLIVDPITGAMYDLTPETVNATLDAMNVKTSSNERSLTVVLAEQLPADAWKNARLIKTN